MSDLRQCRECGCSEDDACTYVLTDGGAPVARCSWVSDDPDDVDYYLCDFCAEDDDNALPGQSGGVDPSRPVTTYPWHARVYWARRRATRARNAAIRAMSAGVAL